ncbi:MAG: orotidine-5'-phosphate decarboxylase [Isosphaeraceae bacterium]
MTFIERVFAAVRRLRNPVVVGIDPRPEELPSGFLDQFPGTADGVAEALRRFGGEVLDVVAPLVPAVKFQSAFYEAYGPAGVAALHASVEDARTRGLIAIVDGKRNDIGSTAEAYARAYLGKVPVGGRYEPTWSADALTVNPYLGSDGILPFVRVATRENRGVFVLVRTSNPSAGEFQDLVADGKPLYRHVADRLRQWASPHVGKSGYSHVGAVVGATYPGQLAELRSELSGILLLVPGYGSQGGTSRDVAAAFDGDGLGALINNSRGITSAHDRSPYRERFAGRWQAAVEQAVLDMIDDLAANTPAGRLRDAGTPHESPATV